MGTDNPDYSSDESQPDFQESKDIIAPKSPLSEGNVSDWESSAGESSRNESPTSTPNPACTEHSSDHPVDFRKSESLSLKSTSRVKYESISSLSVSSSPDSCHILPSPIRGPSSISAFRPLEKVPDPNPFKLHLWSNVDAISNRSNRNGEKRGIAVTDHNFNETNYKDKLDGSGSENQISAAPKKSKLSFGIDRILSESHNSADDDNVKEAELRKDPVEETRPRFSFSPEESSSYRISKAAGPNEISPFCHFTHQHAHSGTTGPLNLSQCSECYFLTRFPRNNGAFGFSPLIVNSSPINISGTPTGGPGGGVPASYSSWMTSLYENSPLLSPSAYHPQSGLPPTYGLNGSNFSTMSSLVACNSVGAGGRRKRSWSRAVFSSLQRKGLEKRFQIQKYITKPDRRQLAATLGLTDAQVKVWFQNRRMKWRHSKEGKVTSGIGDASSSITPPSTGPVVSTTVHERK